MTARPPSADLQPSPKIGRIPSNPVETLSYRLDLIGDGVGLGGVGPVDQLGASEAEHVLVRSSSARRMDRWGAKSPGAMPRRRGAAVVGLRLGGSRLDRWGGLRGYRAFRSAGFADAVACSAWRPRSLGASSRIRIGKGFPIADDPRPPTDSLARVERVERRSTAFRPSRPEPPPTMTIQVPSFSVGRRRAGAFSPAAVESGGDGC